jgi:hypothetical protein
MLLKNPGFLRFAFLPGEIQNYIVFFVCTNDLPPQKRKCHEYGRIIRLGLLLIAFERHT